MIVGLAVASSVEQPAAADKAQAVKRSALACTQVALAHVYGLDETLAAGAIVWGALATLAIGLILAVT